MLSASDILAADGPLAREVPRFAPRAQQQFMAEAVEQALLDNQCLVCEAGTGTGKTFAYLVPALSCGRKVIISTGTRNLQDQLFHRDLPTVRDALQLPVQTALLKGRANYLCTQRMILAGARGRFRSRQESDHWLRVRSWADRTRDGDIAEVKDISEGASIWPLVTSTSDNCLGQECDDWDSCYLVRARRRAQQADVLVVNHHLLLADMALREDGFGELLPGANAFILDEAHQLPEAASQFFGQSMSSRQFRELAGDCQAEMHKDAADMPDIGRAADHLDKAVQDLRLAFGQQLRRAAWHTVSGKKAMVEALQELRAGLNKLHEPLQAAAERGKGLENCLRRCEGFIQALAIFAEQPPEDHIQWFETYRQAFVLHLTPLDIADIFRGHMQQRPAAWVFTSATLAVGDSFAHFTSRMGIDEARSECLDSPFDYARQARLYIPHGLPEPNVPGYTGKVLQAAMPVLRASRGRAFLLFTSYRALNEAAEELRDRLDFPLLVQGSAPRDELLKRFRELGNAVLLGTGSFWEGVDVRGEALSLVVIDKLPFASPDDPMLQARCDAMRRAGGNPFMDYQLPRAVIALKQGAGRLIRDVDDRGVLMLCDPRLISKQYGRLFLKSLPAMDITRSLDEVEAFFADETFAGVSEAGA